MSPQCCSPKETSSGKVSFPISCRLHTPWPCLTGYIRVSKVVINLLWKRDCLYQSLREWEACGPNIELKQSWNQCVCFAPGDNLWLMFILENNCIMTIKLRNTGLCIDGHQETWGVKSCFKVDHSWNQAVFQFKAIPSSLQVAHILNLNMSLRIKSVLTEEVQCS